MSDIPFLELESDAAAIAAFRDRETARTEAAFCDAEFDADVALAKSILEREDYLQGLRRRGTWTYNFKRSGDNPKGLWRRIPQDVAATNDAPWETVFDLDAFCAQTGEDWHWRGAETAFFDGDALLLALSWQGSDQTRYLEWDPGNQQPVPGGFDIGPQRCSASWVNKDTLLVSTSLGEGAATRSGWPGRVVRLRRGGALADAPAVFEVSHEDLVAFAYAMPAPDGTVAEVTGRIRVIGETEKTLYREGIGSAGITIETPKNTQAAVSTTHYAFVAGAAIDDIPIGALVLHEIDSGARRVLFRPEPYVSVSPDSVLLRDRWLLWTIYNRTEPTIWVLNLTAPNATPEVLTLPCEAQSVFVYPHDAAPRGEGPLQLSTTGFLEPTKTWLFDLEAGLDAVTYTKLTEEPPAFDATGMEVQLLSAISADGTEVPYHLVLPAKRGEGPLPVLQYGYGGFGVSMAPTYNAITGKLWLERGGAYVLGYIRGGGEFGTEWHLAAKRRDRARAFEDFAAIAEDLVKRGITEPKAIACHGGSNGGLLCSVMLTRYPDHFGAVWPSVAVTDMARFHLFPAGAGWIDEFGDPDDAADLEAMLAYSPLHNVDAHGQRAYPKSLVTTNDSDDRVDPSHSRRFAAALLAAGQPAYFHARSGGHGGGGATHEAALERALGYAFLRHTIAAHR